MRIILVTAVSQDGYITDKDGSVLSWISKEDQEFFSDIRMNHDLFVMGSSTYDALPKPLAAGPLRVVLTSRVKEYREDSNEDLMFEDLSPKKFVNKYKKRFSDCLLLGGSHVYKDFLEAGLVSEVYLTIEPVRLGGGTTLLADGKSIFDFIPEAPLSSKSLNAYGTTLEHYILKK